MVSPSAPYENSSKDANILYLDQIKKARTHGFPPRPQTSNPTLNPEEDHATAGPSTEPAGQTQDPRIQGGGYRASLTWRPGPLGDSSRPPPPKRQRVDYTQQPDEYTPEQIPKGKMPMTYADQAIENTAWNPMPTPNVINGQNSGFGLAPATMQQHQYPGHPPPQFQNQHFPHFPTYPSVDPSVDNPLSIATHFPIPPLTIPTSTPSASDPSSSSSSQLQGQFPPAAEPLNPADDNFDILNDDDALYAVDDGVQFSADDNFDFDDTIQVAADDIAQIAADDGVQFAPPQNDSQETAQDHVQSPEVCNSQDTLQDVQATDENDQDTIDQDQGLLDVTDLEFEAFFGSNNEDDRTHSPGCDI